MRKPVEKSAGFFFWMNLNQFKMHNFTFKIKQRALFFQFQRRHSGTILF